MRDSDFSRVNDPGQIAKSGKDMPSDKIVRELLDSKPIPGEKIAPWRVLLRGIIKKCKAAGVQLDVRQLNRSLKKLSSR